jgi:aldehyde dehydrogenase (NAD+)
MNYKENIEYRKRINKLLHNLIIHEDEIVEALYKDFKNPFLSRLLQKQIM